MVLHRICSVTASYMQQCCIVYAAVLHCICSNAALYLQQLSFGMVVITVSLFGAVPLILGESDNYGMKNYAIFARGIY